MEELNPRTIYNDLARIIFKWNRSINVIKGAKYKNEFAGFEGHHIKHLGMDFGGFECSVNTEVLNNIIKQCKRGLEEEN